MSDRIRFSYKGQLVEEDKVREVRDDLAGVVGLLDDLLAHDSDEERREDAETRGAVVEELRQFVKRY